MKSINQCAILFFLGLFSIVWAKASDDDKHQETVSRPTLTVTVVNPSYRYIEQTIDANGPIIAKEVATITTRISGLRLNKIFVEVGDEVVKGQLLATYDPESVNNDIAQAKAVLLQAQVMLEQATKNAKRVQKLRISKALSAVQVDEYLFQEKQAQAKVAAARAALNNQLLRQSYTQVKSNANGLIIEKNAILGEVGNLGAPLFSLIVNNVLEWKANVSSESLLAIEPKKTVLITLDNGSQTMGSVRRIDPTINSQTQMGVVYVTMNPNALLRRGLFVRGIFHIGESEALVIPVASVLRKDGYTYVFTVDESQHILRRKVTLGTVYGDSVEVIKGLSDKDKVVNSGVGFLKNGDLVNIVD